MAGFELSPDESGLDRLTEADFVGDEYPRLARLQKLENRFELIGAKDGSRRPERVDRVGKASAKLGPSEGRAEPLSG